MKRLCLLVLVMLIGREIRAQSGDATVLFSPQTLVVGTPDIVEVLIDCQMDSCAAASLSIVFDANILQVDGLSLGEFPARTGNNAQIIRSEIDNATGIVHFSYITIDQGYPSSSGTGILLYLNILGLKEGQPELRFVRASIASQDGETVLAAQTLATYLNVESVASSQTLSVQTETHRPNEVIVITQTSDIIVSEMVVGQTYVLEVRSDTQSPAPLVLDAPGHLACTTDSSQNREIMLLAGDVNNDGHIDVQDAAAVGIALGNDGQNEFDVNHDSTVNIFDLIHIGRNYGINSGSCSP